MGTPARGVTITRPTWPSSGPLPPRCPIASSSPAATWRSREARRPLRHAPRHVDHRIRPSVWSRRQGAAIPVPDWRRLGSTGGRARLDPRGAGRGAAGVPSALPARPRGPARKPSATPIRFRRAGPPACLSDPFAPFGDRCA
jgi:hypothetical protein